MPRASLKHLLCRVLVQSIRSQGEWSPLDFNSRSFWSLSITAERSRRRGTDAFLQLWARARFAIGAIDGPVFL
jgi:hypothetical protein